MPRPEEELISILRENSVDFTASLPCEKVRSLLSLLASAFRHVPLTREEEGVGIAAGAALAGRRPALFVQSTGIGNMINALLSLTVFYQLPLAIFVSRRGIYQERIEAQIPLGTRLPRILQGAGISVSEVNAPGDLRKIARKLPGVYQKDTVHAFLLSPALWEGSECARPVTGCGIPPGNEERQVTSSGAPTAARPALTRYEVLKAMAPALKGKIVVCNLGIPSKELYSILHQPSNFYMLGSMGMATPIGLGIALHKDREIVVIDGDGSILMNPGSLATAASLAPQNLTIVAIDNGAYGSTGDQPTLAGTCVDLGAVARGFGIGRTVVASDREGILGAMKAARGSFTFIHVRAVPGNADVPVIPLDRLEIKKLLQDSLAKGRG